MKTSQLSKLKQEILKIIVIEQERTTHLFTEKVCGYMTDHGHLSDNGQQMVLTRVALDELRADGFVRDTGEQSIWECWEAIPVVAGFLTLPLDDGFLHVRDVRETEPGVLAGTVQILGVLYHVRLMRVSIEVECGVSVQAFHLDAELGEISAAGDPYHTFELPGYEGEWVMTMFPECA